MHGRPIHDRRLFRQAGRRGARIRRQRGSQESGRGWRATCALVIAYHYYCVGRELTSNAKEQATGAVRSAGPLLVSAPGTLKGCSLCFGASRGWQRMATGYVKRRSAGRYVAEVGDVERGILGLMGFHMQEVLGDGRGERQRVPRRIMPAPPAKLSRASKRSRRRRLPPAEEPSRLLA